MEYEVAELEGALLDAAVAKAESYAVTTDASSGAVHGALGPYSPSTFWEQGGPIIERERIRVEPPDDEDAEWARKNWIANLWRVKPSDSQVTMAIGSGEGATPLIAAMRAYVVSKFGDTVELP